MTLELSERLLGALINALGEQTWGGAMATAQRLMRQRIVQLPRPGETPSELATRQAEVDRVAGMVEDFQREVR